MTGRCIAAALALLCFGLGTAYPQPAPPRDLTILYLDRADDPHYRAAPAYTGVLRKSPSSPFPAAELALRDSEAAARAAGVKVYLERLTLKEGETATKALEERAKAGTLSAIVLDLPITETAEAARSMKVSAIPLFNARHRSDNLRTETCATRLFHTLPAWSMLTDGLAQGLMASNWRNILLLEGPGEDDRTFASSLAGSARKFGLRLVDRKAFVSGNDPRKRDQINIRLLTSGVDHDVVAVADASGDFGRTVAYNTARPRPVVGTQGMVAAAWHPYWERNGAPQLNRRFHRVTGRPMVEEDWATWVAMRAIADATVHATRAEGKSLEATLLSEALRIELYKGVPGSFRPWSRQLRQPILLATHDTVITLAPVEGALHQKNNLDTLGVDEAEFRCGG
jgi:ABC transporter substrate binding protein (PQQ-dependent alcohol dehydrogenase system)